MDKDKKPGISIESVYLLRSCVNYRNNSENLKYNLGITSIVRNEISPTKLNVVATFDLMVGLKEPPFNFDATYGVVYHRDEHAEMSWEEFSNGYVITHVLPYFREFASSVTLRLPVPPLIIPPTNVNALLKEYEAFKSKEDEQA